VSKTEGKRGFVRPQPQPRKTAASTSAWDLAQAQLEMASRTHNAACEAAKHQDAPAETLAAFYAARDAVFSTPAPNGSALAYKFGAFLEQNSETADVRTPEGRQWIVQFGSDEDRAALTIYLDALALSGVEAAIVPPAVYPSVSAASWKTALSALEAREAVENAAGSSADDDFFNETAQHEARLIRTPAPHAGAIAEKLRRMAQIWAEQDGQTFDVALAQTWLHGAGSWDQRCVAACYLDLLRQDGASEAVGAWTGVAALARRFMEAAGVEVNSPCWAPLAEELISAAEALEGESASTAPATLVFRAAKAAERLACVMGEHEDGYRNYAINPASLAEIAGLVGALHEGARELARVRHPIIAALAIDAGFYNSPEADERAAAILPRLSGAADLIAEYRALGGQIEAAGQGLLMAYRGPSQRAREIEALATKGHLNAAILSELRREQGEGA
jgi:hypothetical protein